MSVPAQSVTVCSGNTTGTGRTALEKIEKYVGSEFYSADKSY